MKSALDPQLRQLYVLYAAVFMLRNGVGKETNALRAAALQCGFEKLPEGDDLPAAFFVFSKSDYGDLNDPDFWMDVVRSVEQDGAEWLQKIIARKAGSCSAREAKAKMCRRT